MEDNFNQIDVTEKDASNSSARVYVNVLEPADPNFNLENKGGLITKHRLTFNPATTGMSYKERLSLTYEAFGWVCYADSISDYINVLSENNNKDIQAEVTELLEHVLMLRRNAKIERLIARSSISKAELYAPYDSSKINFATNIDLWSLSWAEAGANMFISGSGGTGKTSTAVQFARRAITEKAYSVYRVCSTDLFKALSDLSRCEKAFRRASEVDILILDDVGFEDHYQGKTDDLHKLLDYRMRTGFPTVITTQKGIKAWIKMFDDPDLFKSTIGKFLDKSYILDFSGTPFYKR